VSCPGDVDLTSNPCDDIEEPLENLPLKPIKSPERQGDDNEDEDEDDGTEAKDTCKLTKSKVESQGDRGRITTVETSQTGRVYPLLFYS